MTNLPAWSVVFDPPDRELASQLIQTSDIKFAADKKLEEIIEGCWELLLSISSFDALFRRVLTQKLSRSEHQRTIEQLESSYRKTLFLIQSINHTTLMQAGSSVSRNSELLSKAESSLENLKQDFTFSESIPIPANFYRRYITDESLRFLKTVCKESISASDPTEFIEPSTIALFIRSIAEILNLPEEAGLSTHSIRREILECQNHEK